MISLSYKFCLALNCPTFRKGYTQILTIILTNCKITDVNVIYYNEDNNVIRVLLPSLIHFSANGFTFDLKDEIVEKGNYIAFEFIDTFKYLNNVTITIKYTEA